MTLEEAKALVLREGLMEKDPPDDPVVMILHAGHKPDWKQITRLIETIDTVHEAIEGETIIDRKLAGALWIIGIEANTTFGSDWSPKERDDLISLFNAVESTLVGFWPIGHPRDKDGVENGDCAA